MTSEEQRKKAEEEKTHQKWLAIERARKAREVYEIKEIGLWMLWGPFLGLLVACLAGLMIWLGGESDTTWLWWTVGISIAPLMLFGITSGVDDQWKASVKAKEELHNTNLHTDEDGISMDFGSSDHLLHGFRYKYDYIYTDSTIYYWLYKIAKFICGLSTLLFGAGAAVLLFMWLGTISIAPTTIIIILLVMILMKQK